MDAPRGRAASASTRVDFIAALTAGAIAKPSLATLAADAAVGPPSGKVPRIAHALILSGGGARGAYEAGIITKLARMQNTNEREPLLPYGLVCGTSTGAINAWFVATGQYAALERGWKTISSYDVIRLKKKYYGASRPHRFIGERIRDGLRMATDLLQSETAIAQSQPVLDWLAEHVNVRTPVVTPVASAVTNMTTQSAEYFYRLPASYPKHQSQRFVDTLHVTLGHDAVLREAHDDILLHALFASMAVPLLFDPVELPGAGGVIQHYLDGGIASNTAVLIAHTFSSNIDIVIPSPPTHKETYKSGIDIVLGAYGTMQRKILEGDMRSVYFDSLSKRNAARNLSERERSSPNSSPLEDLLLDIPASTLAYIRPQRSLPVGFASFDRQDLINTAFGIGAADAAHGFAPYVWDTFRL